LVEQVEPHIVFLIGQPWWLAPMLEALRPYRQRLKVVLYMPVEGRLTDADAVAPLRFVDHCILYTEFARENLREILNQLKQPGEEFAPPELHVLPHGVDTQTFHPLIEASKVGLSFDGRDTARRELFRDRRELRDAFIVLNANIPYPRKRIDLTMRGFKLFAQDKPPNVYLYLHHIRQTKYDRKQSMLKAQEAGITDRLLLNHVNPDAETLSEERLNLLYNASDVGINTAMGEGWGLVNFEHAATGAPQIVPKHTTSIENWTGAAELVETVGREYYAFERTEMYVVSAEDVAHKLEKLYQDETHRRQMSVAAYRRATAPRYRWHVIADRLHAIFQNALHAQS
jgi:D-inositol-3-phosphate glycosyltransferase